MEQHRPKPRRRRRFVIAGMVLMLLYVASSGPLQFSHVRMQTATFDDDGHGRWQDGSSADALAQDGQGQDLRGVQLDVALVERAAWWPTVYSPLVWVARQSWGHWLGEYWSLFPIRAPYGSAA
jgi:hypothetical protein